MAYKKLRQLTTAGQAWNIKVKIIRMWESINFSTDELMSLDMILMDEQGETIRATIWKNLIDNYKPKINEGSIYALSNFKVQEDTRYRPVKNTLKIVFVYNTNVKEFASLDTLMERKSLDKQCSDVIGLLTKIKQVETRTIFKNTANPRQKDIREIELLISKDQTVRITLWGDLAHSLNEDVIGKHIVVIVTSTMVEGLQGMISLKTTNGTRIYTDLDIPETWKFIDSVPYEENVPKLMEVDKSTQGTLEDQMFYNRRTLHDITQMRHDNPTEQDFVFTSRATIDRLANTTWWYMACNVCNKMCTKIVSKYHCSKCNKCPDATTPRYLIRLQISDHTATTTCSIFDDEAQRMLKTTITNLLDSLNGKSEDVPKVILELYGKTLIFRFKLNDQNLTEGREYYLVKRTFEPDDKLEFKHLGAESKEEQAIKDPTSKKSHLQANDDRQLEDSEQRSNDKFPLSKKTNKKKRRAFIAVDDSDEDCNNTDRQLEGSEQTSNDKFPLSKKTNKRKRRAFLAVDDSDKDCNNTLSVENHKLLKRSMKKMRTTMNKESSSTQEKHNINNEELIDLESINNINIVPEEVNADQQFTAVLSKKIHKTKRFKRAYRKKKKEQQNNTLGEDVNAERRGNINIIPEETNAERTDDISADFIDSDQQSTGVLSKNIQKTKRFKRVYRKKNKEQQNDTSGEEVNAKRQYKINIIPEENDISAISKEDILEKNIDTNGTNTDNCITPVEQNAESKSNIESSSIPASNDVAPTLYKSTRNRRPPARYRS
ncbi:hypothetical protein BS78_05G005400 [Paspalum vaginatum]|nr:hypothetical protein BS78_05G005400 [Paspalum vaginatum]